MGRSKALILAAALATGATTSALAADLLPPPPPMVEAPPPAPDYGGWYLRGDVGVGAVQMSDWRSTLSPNANGGLPNGPVVPAYASMGDSTFAGAGFGYQFNNWFRADVTGEYRTEAHYRSMIGFAYTDAAGLPQSGADIYSAGVGTALFLANGYIDLGTWHGITPFVGGGVGIAAHNMRGLNDFGTSTAGGPGFGVAADTSKTNFAWAVMGGLAMNVTNNLKLEVGYRYLDMGRMTSNPIQCFDVTGCFHERHNFNLASHDVRLGFRYNFGGAVYAPAPEPMPMRRPLVSKY